VVWEGGGRKPAPYPIARFRRICDVTGTEARAHDAGMEGNAKLQKAGRAFLLRLVAEYGPQGAARILRRLADELEAL
jgi:hypothetical protein